MKTIKENIREELTELKALGVDVPEKAFDVLDIENLDEYENMSVSEAADLIIMLGSL